MTPAFGLAGVTHTVNLKGVASGEVLVFMPDLALDTLDLTGEEFDRTPALRAYHVMVIATIVLVLIASNAIIERDFTGQSALGKKLQRAIDSSKADALVFLADKAKKLVCREMVASIQKGTQDDVALARVLQANSAKVTMKDAFRLTHHLR
jgi:hypothetical protein